MVDVDDVREAAERKITFVTDKEKAALNGISTEQIAGTLGAVLAGETVGLVRSDTERNPLRIELRLPADRRTRPADLAKVQVKGSQGQLVPLAELGRWETARVDQMIYHKNLQRVAYVFAETAGRPPADVVVDILGRPDQRPRGRRRSGDGRQRLDRPRRRPACQPNGRSSPTAAVSRGACRRASPWILPARASGKSRWTCSATSGWPSARR